MMAQQPSPTIQNHFQAGLKTEFTGLNFPENAATSTNNCVYNYIGDVSRRGGLNYEANFSYNNQLNQTSVARSSFRWLNAGGDGESQILVVQIGVVLYFWLSSAATVANPLSDQLISQTVNLSFYQAAGNTNSISLTECQYASGNGYLFVFHPDCDPIYCIFSPAVFGVSAPTITPNIISLQTRDLVGIPELGIADNFRPGSLSSEHLYNLLNQGWTQGSGWTGASTFLSGALPLANNNPNPVFTIQLTSQSATNVLVSGSELSLTFSQCAGTGSNPHNNGTVVIVATVTSYNGAGGTIGLTATSNSNPALNATGVWSGGNFQSIASPVNLTLVNEGFITKWLSVFNNFPSNADVWWLYKDTNENFNPATAGPNVQPATTFAPRGVYLLNPFNQNRSAVSGIAGLTNVTTPFRPSTGAFYQGRVWYAGVNASQVAVGDEPFFTWTESIYFSQIIESSTNFSRCYQVNDPTSQNLFSLLPSDGGVINIPGCGAIYKLFPLRFGLLVFAANGIWFISGSSGIGFTATDYSVTKISNIETISGTSFIEVQGYPFFWNQEGIYEVVPDSSPGSAHSPDIQLSVNNLTLGSILTFYSGIPTISKSFARGDYDMLNYIVQWCYRSTPETSSSLIDRYSYDSIMNYNTITKAFYPYTISVGTTTLVSGSQFRISSPIVSDIKYIQNPGGTNLSVNTSGIVPTGTTPTPIFKYITQGPSNASITFAEENDFINYVDFISEIVGGGNGYTSFFIAGYTLPGQALRKIQTPYVYFFSRNPDFSTCSVQAIWDWVNTSLFSGKQSTRQIITMKNNQFYRKVRLRGRGLAVQLKVSSIAGQPFDLMGWSVWNEVNQGI